ncbi:BTA121 domain-containing protein surface lipoprotein [Borrelia hermsii]|uniref:Uncharacterized protein n=3 Tax=Borrelia hermsii TaxID=140 RepID=T1ECG6_BORHE|nr:hypothetical protein [Borrelia hermsii]ADN26418.2 hypothetical protein BHA154 [Borrelia hermsii]AMR75992.1 hypothetical protein A0V01_05100 [Borrelia hermsii]ANA43796.1 Mrl-type protein [Borrelia hermsii HS1]UCP02025.1 hypothetical protein K9R62_05140 [Borrelia hermsii]UPA08590.1 hypothetical protein bhDAH_001303 [Borrelia hermsii DAH]
MVNVRTHSLLLVLILQLLLIISCNLKAQKDVLQGNLFKNDLLKKPVLGGRVGKDLAKVRRRNVRDTSVTSATGKSTEGKLKTKAKRAVETDTEGVKEAASNQQLKGKLGPKKTPHLGSMKQAFSESASDKIKHQDVEVFSESASDKIKHQDVEVFSESASDKIKHQDVEEGNNEDHFTEIKDDAQSIAKGEKLYAKLSGDDMKRIDYLRSVVTDPDIPGDRTYTDAEFYSMLGNLGEENLIRLIKVHSYEFELVEELKESILVAIGAVKGETLKDDLKIRFNNSNDYPLYLKSLFRGQFTFEQLFVQLLGGNYTRELDKFKRDAFSVVMGEELYAGLSVDEREVIDYIQSVVTDFSLEEAPDDKTYTDAEFYTLLGNLGEENLSRIIRVHLNTFEALNRALRAIKRVKENESKKDLRDRFDIEEGTYAGLLKKAFSEDTLSSVYNRVIKINYEKDKLTQIRDDAKRIIAASRGNP